MVSLSLFGRKPKDGIHRALLQSNAVSTLIMIIPLTIIILLLIYLRLDDQIETVSQQVRIETMQVLKGRVDEALSYANYMEQNLDKRAKEQVKSRVLEAHAIATGIYQQFKNKLPLPVLKEMVREALRPIRFDNGRGYYFAGDLNGIEQLFADRPEMEGKDLLGMTDIEDHHVIQDMIAIIKTKGEDFHEYLWSKPHALALNHRKLSYVKLFEPFGWFIGTGLYFDDVEEEIRKDVLERISKMRWGTDGYIFVFQYDGVCLQHPVEEYIGQNFLTITDPKGIHINERLIDISKSGGGFLEYFWDKYSTGRLIPKISYANGYPGWNWVIGAGAYLEDIEQRQDSMIKTLKAETLTVLSALLVLAMVSLFVSFMIAQRVRKKIDTQMAPVLAFLEAPADQRPALNPEEERFFEFRAIAHAALKLDQSWREAQTEMAKSEALFRSLVQYAPFGILVIETDSAIKYVNVALTEMLGYTIADIADVEAWWLTFCPNLGCRQLIMTVWRRGAEGAGDGSPLNRVCQVRHRDGSTRVVEFVFVFLADRRVLVALNDITERTRIEVELERHSERLEELVEERTRSLEEAVARAEAANRAKSTFLANMSHELRTPLTSVIGFSQILVEDGMLSEDQWRKLAIINGSGNHLLTLINDVLELSKIEAGQVKVESRPTNLIELIETVVEMMRGRVEGKNLTLTVNTGPLPPWIVTDGAKVRQVVLNLLSNALKFTDEGGIGLEVTARPADCGRVRLDLTVTDSGIGIADENQERIFDPFVQAGSVNEQVGTGLGLGISRQFVELLGGELTVASAPGRGSTFHFSLIAEPCEPPEQARKPSVANRVIGVKDDGCGRHRVVIAEDSPEIMLLLRSLLTPLGFEVVEVESGGGAVAAVAAASPSLVIMDWRLREMDGVEATRRIRALDDIRQPVIIMVTASAFEEQRIQALESGANDFLRKPFQAADLYAMLEQWLDLRLERVGTGELAGSGTASEGPPPAPEATIEDIATLPQHLRTALAEGVGKLSPAKISEALGQIARDNPDLAHRLQVMTDRLKYRELFQLLEADRP